MSRKTNAPVRAFTTFALLGAAVALGVASVFSWGSLFAAPALPASDDPLGNGMAIVEPPALVVTTARAKAAPETVTSLDNWEYTSAPPTRHH